MVMAYEDQGSWLATPSEEVDAGSVYDPADLPTPFGQSQYLRPSRGRKAPAALPDLPDPERPAMFGVEQHPQGKAGEEGYHFKDLSEDVAGEVPSHILVAQLEREQTRTAPQVARLEQDLTVCERLAGHVDGPIKGLQQATRRRIKEVNRPAMQLAKRLQRQWGSRSKVTAVKPAAGNGGRKFSPGGKRR